ncbi:MAG TPA: tripartite tricarboxylate transporter substrate binding protein [Burkholderiaceae bacterium]|nr:tripartite tricarboxylate transporter substrate binding protein [Burkholderiaceae bacterium]
MLFAASASVAHADAYPARPVKLVVPYPPGGITDILARTIAQRLSAEWPHPMIIENRAGASGNIGVGHVARAEADGYTLIFGNAATHAINPSLFKSLPYDPIKDFTPVTMVARVSNVLLVGPEFPAKTLAELIALAKSKPGQLTFASNSIGSSNHLTGELLKTKAGIDMVHVPYKSSTHAAIDLIGGRISLMFDNMTTAMPQIQAGKLRALAVTSEKRLPQLPEVPTMVELGMKDFIVTPWWGVFAPAGTPREVVQKLNRDIVKVLNSKEVLEYLSSQATDVVGDSPEQFARYVSGEKARWADVVKASGATAD